MKIRMNKLKEMNGKYYQECEVVMLAADKIEGGMYSSMIAKEKGKLFNYSNPNYSYDNATFQHLYITSNEEIKIEDYVIDSMGELFGPYEKGDIIGKEAKKIIATTDISLQLPQPSKSFIQAYIKAYNKSNPITKVLVEMEGIGRMKSGGEFTPITYKLKINSNNEITIKKIKDSYTREEYFKGLKHAIERAIQYPEMFITGICCDEHKINNWIEQNL